MANSDFNIFVGSETGLLKGLNINEQKVIAKNLNNLSNLDRSQEIRCLDWGEPEETTLLVGLRCQKVRIYDTDFRNFSGCVDVTGGEGPLQGLAKFEGALVTAVESGIVKVWKLKAKEPIEIKALNNGETLARMKASPVQKGLIATGGKENDLQLWDLNAPEKPVFKAKNVPHDFLDMRVPVWVSDMTFMPESSKVAICSRHGHVRIYDTSTGGRKPVLDVKPEDESWTSISSCFRENQVVVGSARGRMLLYDLRMKRTVIALRGAAGGIRQVVAHKTKPYIVSVGLDRHLRVHDLRDKKLLSKAYLKSRLNCALVKSDFSLQSTEEDKSEQTNAEDEAMWESMGVVQDDVAEDDEVVAEDQPKKKKKRTRTA